MNRTLSITTALLAGVLLTPLLLACGSLAGGVPQWPAPPNGDQEPGPPQTPSPGQEPTVPMGTQRVSVHTDGTYSDRESWSASSSEDGRYVVFVSMATNLVDGDTNRYPDVFVHDRATGTTSRVSVAGDGTESDRASMSEHISSDARIVAFASRATNLVADGGDDRFLGVFVHDRTTGTTTRASVASDGAPADADSWPVHVTGDGRLVFFASEATDLVPHEGAGRSLFVRDLHAGTTVHVPLPEGFEWRDFAAMSRDGRFITYGATEVIVYDRVAGTTELASVNSAGAAADGYSQGASMSADGRFVGFSSAATNLHHRDDPLGEGWRAYVRDRETGTTELVATTAAGDPSDGRSERPIVSADGRFVLFESDAVDLVPGMTAGKRHLYVWDRVLGTYELVPRSIGPDAISRTFTLSGDGRSAVFLADGGVAGFADRPGLDDVFAHSLAAP